MASQEIADLQTRMRIAVQLHWKALLMEGVLFIVLGLTAMIVPTLASLALTVFLGWVILISGVAGLVLTFWQRQMPGVWWSLLSAILAIGAGVVLLVRPVQGTLTLTIVVAAYLLAEGIATVMYALEHRRELSERWTWLLTTGILDLMLAALIVVGLPGSALWAIGFMVGVNMVLGGVALTGMSLAARKANMVRTNCGWGQTS
jgi:uncharacterized membrane protein HdeD (DUF308 family)